MDNNTLSTTVRIILKEGDKGEMLTSLRMLTSLIAPSLRILGHGKWTSPKSIIKKLIMKFIVK